MTPQDSPENRLAPSRAEARLRWLGVGAGFVLVLAALVAALGWQRAVDERRKAEDVGARVSAEMNRIEAEAKRMEREAGQ